MFLDRKIRHYKYVHALKLLCKLKAIPTHFTKEDIYIANTYIFFKALNLISHERSEKLKC